MKLKFHDVGFFLRVFYRNFSLYFWTAILDFSVFLFVLPNCPPLLISRGIIAGMRHGVLANRLVECFSLDAPNMVLSKLNIQKLDSKQTRGSCTFQPLWVSGGNELANFRRTPFNECFNDASILISSIYSFQQKL